VTVVSRGEDLNVKVYDGRMTDGQMSQNIVDKTD
jgi:hypothetical protein